MADVLPPPQVFVNAGVDSKTIEDTVNGAPDTQVTSRLGRKFWTLATINSRLNLVVLQADEAIRRINEAKDNAQGALDNAVQDFNEQGDVVLTEFRDAIQTIVTDDGVPAQVVVVGDSTLDVFAEKVTQNTVSIADMLAVRNPKNGTRFAATGYYEGSLLGGGEFIYIKNSTLIADNGVVFNCPDGGRWVRLHSGTVSFDDYGAKRDGTDQSIAIENCISNIYCRRIEQESGEFIVSRTLKKMLPRTSIKMHPDSLIKIVSLAGGVRLFMPAKNCDLQLQVDGNQYPLSGDIKDDWVGNNNRSIASLAEGYSYGFDGHYNVKNVKVANSKFINIAEPVRADGSQNWTFQKNYFENIKQSCCLQGASDTSPVSNNKFTHNTCINVGDTVCATFQLQGHPNAQISGVQMCNNFAKNTQMRTMGWAFDFEGVSNAGDCKDGIISNNVIFQTSVAATMDTEARGGCVAGENCENIQIIANTVIGVGLGYGININRSINSTVKLNTVRDFAGGGITMIGSIGADVDINKLNNCFGTTINSAAIAIMIPSWDFITRDFSVTNNKITTDANFVRSGNAPAIAVQPASSVDLSESLNGVISGNKIIDANGTGIHIQSSSVSPILGVLLEKNKVYSKFGTQSFQITNAKDINVDDFYSRGCSRWRVSNCNGDIRLRNLDCENTINAVSVINSTNIVVEDSRLTSPNGTYFESAAQFTDTTLNNKLINVKGTRRSSNKGTTATISSGANINHGLAFAPSFVDISPAVLGLTDYAVTAITDTNFKIEFTGLAQASFRWQAEL